MFERSHRATGAFPTSFKHTRYASHGDAMWHQAESFRNVLSLRKQSTDVELLQTLELNQISETASDEETEAQGKPRYPVAAPHLGLPPTWGSPPPPMLSTLTSTENTSCISAVPVNHTEMTATDNCNHPQCHSTLAPCAATTKIKESLASFDFNNLQEAIV